MPNLVEAVRRTAVAARRKPCGLPSVRPSLLDLRFTGDPWVVDQHDGTAILRLANYSLTRIRTSPLDLPSLNNLVQELRLCQVRRAVLARCRR